MSAKEDALKRQLAEQREQRESLAESMRDAAARIALLDARLAEVPPPDDPEAAAKRKREAAEHAELGGSLESIRRSLDEVNEVSAGLLGELISQGDPALQVGQLDGDVPLLLLPVRLEVRFRGAELLVRVFPDAAAVDTLERSLTVDEQSAARAFWEAHAAAADEAGRRAAWAQLVAVAGRRRAGWIARRTRKGADDVPLAPSSWSRAPQSHVMPERLVFMALDGGEVVQQVVGAPIPDPLAVGPDPSAAASAPAGEAPVDPAMRWMVDFEEAVRVGMAARIPLDPARAAAGFERLVVVGVRTSSNLEDSRRRLEELVEAHTYSSGLSLLRTGTPTNTTAATLAAHTPQQDVDESFALELGPPAFEPGAAELDRRDGDWLVEALGIRPELLARVEGAGGTELREARLMNRALWPATLGYYLEQMMGPVFSLETVARVREFLDRWVTARGPLPPLRIGGQPYGVVPTTAFSRIAWKEGTRFETELHGVLRRAHEVWRELARRVPRVTEGHDEQALLEVLASAPSATSVTGRVGVGRAYLTNVIRMMTGDGGAQQVTRAAQEATVEALSELGYRMPATPRVLEAAFRASRMQLRPLVAPAPLSEDAPLPALAEDGSNYLQWLARSDVDALRLNELGTEGGAQIPPPQALLYMLVRQSLLLAYWDAAMKVHVGEGKLEPAARIESELVNVLEAARPDRWDQLRLESAASGGKPIGQWLRTEAARGLREARELNETRAAIDELAGLPTARLERLLAEHLDLCSYRLDAWEVGFARQRLAELRAGGKGGAHLGAYGWLEDVRPGAAGERVDPGEAPEAHELPDVKELLRQPDNAGFVHAPSLAQATTAAVLRNGALTHAADGALQIDLSSERARRAAGYLDGMRHEQPLEALLGQRFERALHVRSNGRPLDRFVLEFRTAFPASAGRVVGADASRTAPELTAGAVVDGAALVHAVRSRSYPYGVDGLPPAGSSDARGVEAAVGDLLDDFDALADLLLAEGVHQSLTGNFERAAAALRTVSDAAPPPEVEVLKTPRAGTSLTHRVAVLLDPAAGPGPWEDVPETPRAAAEPRLDAWLAERFGPPKDIRCRVLGDGGAARELTPLDLGLRPLDLALLLGGAGEGLAELEALVRAVAGDGEVRLVERDPDWDPQIKTFVELFPLAAVLGETISAARPLAQRDLRPASLDAGDPDAGFDLDELDRRARAAVERIRAARTELAAASTPGRQRGALLDAWRLGLPGAVPGAEEGLGDQVRAAGDELERRGRLAADALEAAGTAPDGARLRSLTDAFAAVFGGAFRAVPLFEPDAPGIGGLVADDALLADAPAHAAEAWLEASGRVRRAIGAVAESRTLADLLGQPPPRLRVVQLPRREGERWVALAPPEGTAASASVSIVLDGSGEDGLPAGERVAAGLLIDEWVEVVPAATQLTGIAFHHDSPGAEPPQSLLLAVPPQHTDRWSWDDVVDAVLETLELGKVRAVDPDLVAQTAFAQLLPAAVLPVSDAPVSIVADLSSVVAGGVAPKSGAHP
jgi:hypothetical protein